MTGSERAMGHCPGMNRGVVLRARSTHDRTNPSSVKYGTLGWAVPLVRFFLFRLVILFFIRGSVSYLWLYFFWQSSVNRSVRRRSRKRLQGPSRILWIISFVLQYFAGNPCYFMYFLSVRRHNLLQHLRIHHHKYLFRQFRRVGQARLLRLSDFISCRW